MTSTYTVLHRGKTVATHRGAMAEVAALREAVTLARIEGGRVDVTRTTVLGSRHLVARFAAKRRGVGVISTLL